jgi:hypothetical protein
MRQTSRPNVGASVDRRTALGRAKDELTESLRESGDAATVAIVLRFVDQLQDVTDRVLFGQCRRAWVGGSVATETSGDGRPDQCRVQESVWRCHQVVDAAQCECRPGIAVH